MHATRFSDDAAVMEEAAMMVCVEQFLFAHTLGDSLAFEALPETFPEYCEILP